MCIVCVWWCRWLLNKLVGQQTLNIDNEIKLEGYFYLYYKLRPLTFVRVIGEKKSILFFNFCFVFIFLFFYLFCTVWLKLQFSTFATAPRRHPLIIIVTITAKIENVFRLAFARIVNIGANIMIINGILGIFCFVLPFYTPLMSTYFR